MARSRLRRPHDPTNAVEERPPGRLLTALAEAPHDLRLGVGDVRVAAAAAALALAVTSTGHGLVLAGLLGVAAWSPVAAVAAVLAVVTGLRRWGSIALSDWAGAQAVTGVGATTGTSVAVAGAWLAAAALLATARPGGPARNRAAAVSAPPGRTGALAGRLRTVTGRAAPVAVAAPAGVAAALLVVGPGPGGPLALRVAGSVIGIALALALATARRRAPLDRAVGFVGLVCGAVAVGVVAG
jgi:hypothetical protein